MPDITKSWQWAVTTCNAPNIQYSQEYNKRWQGTVGGITYYDCSSFIYFALKAGGFPVPSGRWYTGDMVDPILAMGFVEVPLSGEWKRGDIGWTRTGDRGHTEMVYEPVGVGGGICMGAHGRNNRAPVDQVSISDDPSYASRWMLLLRYGDGAGDTVYGLPYAVVCALCGNAYAESQICPNQYQVGGSAFGLFQWDGERRTNFENWLAENGYNVENGNYACEYLVYEGDWQPKIAYPEFNTLQDFLYTDITDIDYLTEAFCRCWERAGVEHMDVRKMWAHKCYDYIINHANDTSIVSWINNDNPQSTYLNDEQASLNNAVMLYRYFCSGGGGGGTPSEADKNMSLMMYPFKRRGVTIKW